MMRTDEMGIVMIWIGAILLILGFAGQNPIPVFYQNIIVMIGGIVFGFGAGTVSTG